MEIESKFSLTQLQSINEQSMMYTCACPAQVSVQMINLRKLFKYQYACLDKPSDDDVQQVVHQRIAEASIKAHQTLEDCLNEILDLEGWDRSTLTMPAGLRQLIEKSLDES